MGILIIYSLLYHINNKPNSLPSAYFKIQNLLKTMQQSRTPNVTRKPRKTRTSRNPSATREPRNLSVTREPRITR